jgi:hypothetical protein
MIVELSDRVKTLVIQERNRERDHDLLQNLSDTIDYLNAVNEEALQLKNLCTLLKNRLSDPYRSSIQSSLQELMRQLRASQKDFADARRQSPVLKSIREQLARLISETKVSWKLTAEKTLKPTLDLYSLVRNLPDFKAQEVALGNLKNRLEYFQENVPKSTSELRDFDQKLTKLKEDLTSIPGLTPKVQAFLAKMVDHTATLADLDDEVLTWCRRPGRSKAFMITFKS